MPDTQFPQEGDPGTISIPIKEAGPGTQPIPDVTLPIVHVDSRIRMFNDMRRKLFPGEIRGILASALMGDLFHQEQLFSIMFDSWPRLQKNLRELTGAVSKIKYVVTPFKEENAEDATPSAIDKADCVRRAFAGMTPLITRNEHNFEGLIKVIVESTLTGITVSEILWELRPGPKGQGQEYMPKATFKLPALFYRYPTGLDNLDELLLNPTGEFNGINLVPWPENKFIIAISQGHSGHPSTTMALRCLAALWAANVFGLEWFCTNAQLFGIPFRKGTFEKGDTEGYNLLMAMLAKMGTAGYAALPVNTNVEFINAPGTGGIGPAERLVDLSDRICDIFILGQTLSTDVGNSGSRALGQVHAQVKQDVMEQTADYSAGILQTQFVPGILMMNYGNIEEMPTIEPDMEEPQDELGLAQRDVILFGPGPAGMGLPVTLKYLYKRHNVPEPEPKDKLYEIPAPPAPPPIGGLPAAGAKTGANGNQNPAAGQNPRSGAARLSAAQIDAAGRFTPHPDRPPAFDEEYDDDFTGTDDDPELESLADAIIDALNEPTSQ
jgi:phage gp29-like protein